MANPDILNAAPMKRVPSRSPHPPKTDKFSKIDQIRKTQPTVESPTIVPGQTVAEKFAGPTGATANAFIDSATKQLKISGNIPIVTSDTITKIFTAKEEDGSLPTENVSFDQTVNPQPDTSGEKSASDTSSYLGG